MWKIFFSADFPSPYKLISTNLDRPWSPRPSMITYIPQDHHDKFDPGNFWHRLYIFPENLGELIGNSIGRTSFFIEKLWILVAYFFNNTNNLINEKFDFYKLKSRSSFFLSDMIDRLAYTMPGIGYFPPKSYHMVKWQAFHFAFKWPRVRSSQMKIRKRTIV
jgi:hypothetical protein